MKNFTLFIRILLFVDLLLTLSNGQMFVNSAAQSPSPASSPIVAVKTKNSNDNSKSETTIKKLEILQNLAQKMAVCYDRFQRCASRLSPSFCASPIKGFTFYIWARKMAHGIMSGQDDNFENIHCTPDFIRSMLYGQLQPLINHILIS